MSTFEQIFEKQNRLPTHHVLIEDNHFAADWQDKPAGGGLLLGLRRFSDADAVTAKAEAAKFAIEMHDDQEGQIEAYNEALMRWCIVRGTCDPNDITQNAPIFDGSEENVRNALTSAAIRYVWDHIDRFHTETGPLVVPIKDEEIEELATMMREPGQYEKMSRAKALRVRKLLGFCLSEFREAADVQPTE